jgi:hypothetical protein
MKKQSRDAIKISKGGEVDEKLLYGCLRERDE